ncbi:MULTISPECIES: hypothetical protein, partial [unclassified Aerococcus]|uniref:hypothetical protein n=1 Tax=unclassified Aerococcus TaxID=2618060 RepID=UPI001AEF5CB0
AALILFASSHPYLAAFAYTLQLRSVAQKWLPHTLVGLRLAEIAPLHQNPSKAFILLWLLAPEVYFSR